MKNYIYYTITDEESSGSIINSTSDIMDAEICSLPMIERLMVLMATRAKTYPFIKSCVEPIIATAHRDPRDEHNEAYVRKLIALKLEYKQEQRIAKQYHYLSLLFARICNKLTKFEMKHMNRLSVLDKKLGKILND